MQKEMWMEILTHQLKGIMFHVDAYGLACLHGYKRMRMAQCRQALDETEKFMLTHCKAIEHLGEIPSLQPVQNVAIPTTATEAEIANMWLRWEMETANLYTKAEESDGCPLWKGLHKGVTQEINYIFTHFS